MATFDTIPALIRILLVFIVILFCIRRKLALGHCFTLGAILLGLVFGMGPVAILQSVALSLSDPKTLSLAVIVSLILVLSHSLEAGGQMERLLNRFQGLVRVPALNLVVFPALIGLLPMPGGAVFSAPMVKNLGQRGELGASELSYVNYWFRHVWEYWWPLYPGILLIAAIGDLNLWLLVVGAFPMTLVAVAAGYWPLRGRISFHVRKREGDSDRRPSAGPFLKELTPIAVAIVLGLGLGILFSRLRFMGDVAKESGLILALILAIYLVWRSNGLSWSARRRLLLNPKLGIMVYMVAGILVFGGMLEDSRAVSAVSQELMQWRIPLTIVAVLLPMIVGLVTGITIAFVGTTFPILISLIHALNATQAAPQALLPYMVLGLVSGFVGVLCSPLHVCLLLSNEYFETSLNPVYRNLWIPCLALLGGALIYFRILQWF